MHVKQRRKGEKDEKQMMTFYKSMCNISKF